MAEEKTRTQLIDEAKMLADADKTKFPPARKYKEDTGNWKKAIHEFDGVEISIGTRVIIQKEKRGRGTVGYLLCAVLDFDDNETWWSTNTGMVVEVLDGSNAEMKEDVGRLKFTGARSWFGGGCAIVAVGKAKWDNYKLKEHK